MGKEREIIVTGGRNYDDSPMMCDVLNFLAPSRVIQGGAPGADTLAVFWCEAEDVEHKTYIADWATHGRAAGPIRNKEMLDAHPEAVVVAFPGGRGTEDCVRQAQSRNMIILRVEK